jgi:hypothetical protein
MNFSGNDVVVFVIVEFCKASFDTWKKTCCRFIVKPYDKLTKERDLVGDVGCHKKIMLSYREIRV